MDAIVTNTPIFLRTSTASNGKLAGSIVLNNIQLNNVPTAVGVVGGQVVLSGGTTTINTWAQGNVYSGTSSSGRFVQGSITAPNKASSLLDSSGRIFGKTHPQYADYDVSQILNVKSQGAKGDGNTDDTAALQAIFNKVPHSLEVSLDILTFGKQFSGCKIIYFDAGTYIVTSTLQIPAGTQIVGEAWSVIMGSGSNFNNQNIPQVVVQAGAPNSVGILEISDIVFATRGPGMCLFN